MRKRVLRIVLFAVLSAISALAVIAGCSDKARSITLANFEDQTIEVDYGAVVQTDNSAVYDTDGNVYGVTATVTDADGKNVALVNGAFIADDMRGYKIVYTLVDTSVSAKSKTVTVIVKNDGTPAVYFTDTITAVWTGEEYPVPAYKYTVGSQYAITGNTLELFKVQGENRTKVESFDAAAEKFAVTEAGDYVFVATVTAGEKSTKVELAFEAKNEAQRYAIASCESPANINIADDYYESGAHADKEKPVIAYSADVKRNAYVSHGSVSVSVKSGYGDLGIWATPEISANDFTQRLSEPDTMISAWIYVSGEAESYNVFSVIDSDMPKSAAKSIAANTWTNILLNPDRTDLLKLYNDLCTGKTLFTVQSGESGDVTVYVDSIYVSEPVAKSSTFASVAANTNEEFTVRAESTSGGKFYYTVEGAEENETGTFTSSVVGAILATAYPVQNRYYGVMTTVVTLSGGEHTFSFAQAEQTLNAGTHDLLAVTTDYEDVQNIVYELLKADGSTCYSEINGDKMRLFEGEHLLTASMTVNDIRYRAITKLSVSPAPVYDAATIEDFDNSYSQDNLEQTQHWNHIPLTYVGDYDGHTGVIKLDLTNMGNTPGFKTVHAIGSANWSATYDEDDFIAFDMKVEGTIPDGAALCNNENGFYYQDGLLVPGWHTYYLSLKNLKFLDTGNVFVFFGGAPEGGNFGITVYIDRIYAVNWESRIRQVTLVDFDDETKQADLYDTISVTHADVKDTEGNTYKVKATVTGPDGETVAVSGDSFVAQKAGTYTVVYTVDDKMIAAKSKTVTVMVTDPYEGWEYTFAFGQEEYSFGSGTHDSITVDTNYTGGERITYTLSKADGSTCYSKISENGTKMRLFEGEHLLTAAMTVDGVKYSAIATINVSPAPVYDNATIEDFDNSYSLDNIGHTQDWNHIPYTYMGDYDGHSGVIKLDLTNLGNNPGFSIKKPLADTDWSAEYGADDYVAIDMKVEGNIPQGVAIIKNYPNCYVELESGWHTYYLSMDKMGFLSGENIALFFGGVDGENKFGITVYIDRIYASPARPAIEANTIEDFNHPVSMGNLAVHEMPVEYLPEYEGKTGILKLDLTEETAQYPKFQIGAPIGTVNKNNFIDGYIAIDMYVEGTIPEGAIIGNVYNGSLYFQDGSLVNGWHTYYLSLEKLQWLNYNVVEACFAKNPSGAFGITVYIDRIYAVTQAEKDAATNG